MKKSNIDKVVKSLSSVDIAQALPLALLRRLGMEANEKKQTVPALCVSHLFEVSAKTWQINVCALKVHSHLVPGHWCPVTILAGH